MGERQRACVSICVVFDVDGWLFSSSNPSHPYPRQEDVLVFWGKQIFLFSCGGREKSIFSWSSGCISVLYVNFVLWGNGELAGGEFKGGFRKKV